MKKHKICIISLHKTGTTSVALLLQKLGYLVTGPDTNLYYDLLNDNFKNIDKYIESYDAFQDDPWYDIFEYIDNLGLNVKFVYLKREEKSWLLSVQNFYQSNQYNNRVRKHFYGHENTLEYPEIYLQKYRNHEERVMEYFHGKTNFITVDIKKDEDAIRLQNFLELPIVFQKFPWVNKTPKNKKEKIKRKIRLFVLGYFGLNILVKRILIRFLSNEDYIVLRSKIRYSRAYFRKYKVNFKNKFLNQNNSLK
ncbi:sulfotransferase [Formosa sp. 4Alg 33]|uniref:sulfotransferase n=1 Tax=Formosa sp. 4Alg 33 TaxID=3382189 RepID=UPI003D9C64C6